jgi:23S rRNA (uracil1939-C5)-methyltransferase
MKIVFAPEFALGYRQAGSHEIEPVHECPISSPLINRALAAFWQLGAEAAKFQPLREVQFFANHDDSELLIELSIHHSASPGELAPLAKLLRQQIPELRGAAVFASASDGRSEDDEDGGLDAMRRISRSAKPFIEGEAALQYSVAPHTYRVSAGSFFQTNRFLTAKLVELVTANREGRAALDLFAGVGLFTLPLARRFERVTAVEIAPSASLDLALNASGPHVRTFQSTTADFLSGARGRWDYAVADPPRGGMGEAAIRSLAALRIPRLTLVSCDPATLARDLAVLCGEGYGVEEAHLLDLFPQTGHMESVLRLHR